ncbi:MAG TPA: hypothetical protein GX699_05155 [Firmicutes bacterium]|jgi:hypothetical protein|nr:hypothetical protein [Bacillota bacterium]
MNGYAFTYTLHHVLLLKLLAALPFDRVRTLHNFFFLALANCPAAQCSGIRYEFYKGATGVHSFEIQSFVDDLKKSGLVCEEALALTKAGREFYCQVASLLHYERFPAYCLQLAGNYRDSLWRVNHEVIFHPLFRKSKTGRKILLPPA